MKNSMKFIVSLILFSIILTSCEVKETEQNLDEAIVKENPIRDIQKEVEKEVEKQLKKETTAVAPIKKEISPTDFSNARALLSGIKKYNSETGPLSYRYLCYAETYADLVLMADAYYGKGADDQIKKKTEYGKVISSVRRQVERIIFENYLYWANQTTLPKLIYYSSPNGLLSEILSQYVCKNISSVEEAVLYHNEIKRICKKKGTAIASTGLTSYVTIVSNKIYPTLKTTREARLLYSLNVNKYRSADERKLPIVERWDGLAMEEMKTIKTIEQSYKFYYDTRKGSLSQAIADGMLDIIIDRDLPKYTKEQALALIPILSKGGIVYNKVAVRLAQIEVNGK